MSLPSCEPTHCVIDAVKYVICPPRTAVVVESGSRSQLGAQAAIVRLERLGAGRQAGVDDGDRAAGVAGVLGGEKRDGGPDLLRGGGAFERQRLEQVAPVLRIAGAFFRMAGRERSIACTVLKSLAVG
jgi:hypothetical protein